MQSCFNGPGPDGIPLALRCLQDLDNFLDNYLVQLQTDHNMQQNPNAVRPAGMLNQQARPALQPGMLPGGNLNLLQQQGLLNLSAGAASGLQLQGSGALQSLGLSGAAMLNTQGLGGQFHALQTGGMPMQAAGYAMGGVATAPGAAQAPPPGTTKGAKTTRKGKAANAGTSKQNKKSEAEPSSSEEDSSDSGSSDGEQKSRKKHITADEAERRHLALQEKNRRAQRRFRERQKVCQLLLCLL